MTDARFPRDRHPAPMNANPRGPRTLSLPTIPSVPRAAEAVPAPPPHGKRRSGGERPREKGEGKRRQGATTRAVAVAESPGSVQIHRVRPLGGRHLPLTPERSLRRTLLVQGTLALLAVALLVLVLGRGGGVAQGANASPFTAEAALHPNLKVVDRVPIQTQIDPTIGYDSPAQYKAYSLASCSAASSSSVLLAWGDPQGRVGQVIDDMAPYLTTAGLGSLDGFRQLAARHNFNVIVSTQVTAGQIAELVSAQGIPVIVGIRDDYNDYYRYFAPGHYLVIVGADANGFRVVDNSTYFVHYLPTATFMQLWTLRKTIIFTPKDYSLALPITTDHP